MVAETVPKSEYNSEYILDDNDSSIYNLQQWSDKKHALIYNLDNFHKDYGWKDNSDETTLKERLIRKTKKKCQCDKESVFSSIRSFFPITEWLPKYSWKKNIVFDIIGGLTIGIMSIPQGMAYAKLAGMPTVIGLYMVLLPPLFYLIFGTCRHAAMGSVTITSLMMGALRYKILPCENCWQLNTTLAESVKNFSNSSGTATNLNSLSPVDIGMATAFLVGFYLILMGILRLDILTHYLSDQIVSGFTVGAAVHIFTAQLDSSFGLKIVKMSGPGKILYDYMHLFEIIHDTNIATMIIAWSSVGFLLILKLVVNPRVQPKIRIPLPGELFVVIAGIFLSYFANVNKMYAVKIVDYIPAEFPKPILPRLDIMGSIAVDALLIAVITYCQAISQAKLYGKTHQYKIDSRQEFFACGIMNCVASFFQCYNSGLSVSRTIVFEKTGAKSQLATIISVSIVIITILFISPYLALLPQGILASIIIVACVDLFRQLKELKYLWKVSKTDFAVYVVTVLSIVLLDVTYGLLFSVLFAFFVVVLRTQCRPVKVIGSVPGTDMFAEVNRYSRITERPRIKVVHFSAPLYYANVESFKQKLYKKCSIYVDDKSSINTNASNSVEFEENPIPRQVVIDCSGMVYVDLMGVNVMKQVFKELNEFGIKVWFAQLNCSVQKTLQKTKFFETIPMEHVFVSVRDAVHHADEFDKNNVQNKFCL